jgi:adenosine 3'-phospho 5'-phosphosulfate transporter B2
VLRKRYRVADYASAAGVAAGCALFALSGSAAPASRAAAAHAAHASQHALDDEDASAQLWRFALGAAMLLCYLAFDGFTSTYQERLFKDNAAVSASHLVLHVAVVAAAMTAAVAAASGQLAATAAFVSAHPAVGMHIGALSLAAAGASLLINDTIKRFGALTYAGIMTSRQLLSVLASAVAFRQPLSAGQCGGTAAVFVALYARLLWSGGRRSARMSGVLGASMHESASGSALAPAEARMLQRRTSTYVQSATAAAAASASAEAAAATGGAPGVAGAV